MIHKKERQLIEWEKIFASDILNWKVKVNSIMSNSLGPSGLYSPWNSPGQNIRVGSLLFLQGIFPTQGLNPGFLHCRQILYQMSHKRSPRILEWVAISFSTGSSQPRDRTCVFFVSSIAGRFFTHWATGEAHKFLKCLQTICDPSCGNSSLPTWHKTTAFGNGSL